MQHRMRFERLKASSLPAARPGRFQPPDPRANRPLARPPLGARGSAIFLLAGFVLFAGDVALFRQWASLLGKAACLPALAPDQRARLRRNTGPDVRPRTARRAFLRRISADGRPGLHLGGGQDLLHPWRARLSGPDRSRLRLHDQNGDRWRPGEGRVDHHPAGRQISAPGQQLLDRPQGTRGNPGVPAGIDAQQGADPGDLPQLHLPWPKRLRRPGGEPCLFRQGRPSADAA